MKATLFVFSVFLVAIGIVVYQNKHLFINSDNLTQVSVFNSPSTYIGRLPCADCPGIDATLTLFGDTSYTQQYVYINKGTIFDEKGIWTVIKGTPGKPNATGYQLTSTDGTKSYYILQGRQLSPLDSDLNEIPAPYNAPLIKQ